MIRPLALALALLTFSPPVDAQIYSQIDEIEASLPGFFYFARPGEPVMEVTTVGAVPARGRVLIGLGTRLSDFIALVGGVQPDRAGQATLRLYRDDALLTELDALDLYDGSLAPIVLEDGDVVEVVGLLSTVPGFYVHTEPGNEPFEITVAGAFDAVGLYRVDPGTTLGEIVVLAGGAGVFGERGPRTEITATVYLYRDGAPVAEIPLEEIYGRETQTLQPGDVVDLQVRVRENAPFWRDALSVITTVASLILLTERLAN